MITISISCCSNEDLDQIVLLHQQYLRSGFITSLGRRFLLILYKHILESDSSFCVVAKKKNRVIGFVTGTENVSDLYREFLKKKFLVSCLVLLPQILNPKIFRGIFETFTYPRKRPPSINFPKAELLTIVVSEEFQGMGVSHLLFEALKEEFKRRNINEFKVTVGSGLKRAIRFYEKMGCEKKGEIEIHRGEISYIYVYSFDKNKKEDS